MSNVTTAKLEIELYPESSQDVKLRQVGLGIESLLILEVFADEDSMDGVAYRYTGSMIETPEELRDLIQSFLAILNAGIEQNAEEEGDVD